MWIDKQINYLFVGLTTNCWYYHRPSPPLLRYSGGFLTLLNHYVHMMSKLSCDRPSTCTPTILNAQWRYLVEKKEGGHNNETGLGTTCTHTTGRFKKIRKFCQQTILFHWWSTRHIPFVEVIPSAFVWQHVSPWLTRLRWGIYHVVSEGWGMVERVRG